MLLIREIPMKSKTNYLLLFCLVTYLVLSLQISSSKTNLTWSNIEETLIYDYQRTDTIYDDQERVTEVQALKDTYRFWNFSIDENQLIFRTNKYSKALDQLFCFTDEGYNYSLYRQFEYDPKTDSIILGFEFDAVSECYYLIDGLLEPFANYFDCYLPLDLVNIYLNNYYWDGIYGIVIPVNSETFVFKTDYSDYYDNFSSIDCQYTDSFDYLGKDYKGHCLTITFTGGELFGSTVVTEDHILQFKYSDIGFLISFEDYGKMFSNISNNVKLEKTISWRFNLREQSISKSFFPIFCSICCLIVVNLLIRRRKTKMTRF